MIKQVKEKSDLLVDNFSGIHKKFVLEAKLMSLAAGLVFTSAGKKADVERMKECRKLLEKKTGILSNFRLTTELVLVSKMALSKDPEAYLDYVIAAYKKISKGTLLENSYMVLAAILICDFERQNEIDEIVDKANEIVKAMNKEHPILTANEDTSFAVFLALSYKDANTIINDVEECYKYLKETCKCKASSNAIQGLSEVLAITYGDMKHKCDKVMRIFNAFTAHEAEYGTGDEFVALGSLIDIDLDPDTLVNEIIEAEAYLKGKIGIGEKERKERLMYAALIVVYACGGNTAIMDNAVISDTLSILISQRISTMITIITNIISFAASAAGSSEEKKGVSETDTPNT